MQRGARWVKMQRSVHKELSDQNDSFMWKPSEEHRHCTTLVPLERSHPLSLTLYPGAWIDHNWPSPYTYCSIAACGLGVAAHQAGCSPDGIIYQDCNLGHQQVVISEMKGSKLCVLRPHFGTSKLPEYRLCGRVNVKRCGIAFVPVRHIGEHNWI